MPLKLWRKPSLVDRSHLILTPYPASPHPPPHPPRDQVSDQLKALEASSGVDGVALKALLEKAVGESSYVEERGKRVPGFTYLSAAEANKIVALRRKQVRGGDTGPQAHVVIMWSDRRGCVGRGVCRLLDEVSGGGADTPHAHMVMGGDRHGCGCVLCWPYRLAECNLCADRLWLWVYLP